MERGSSSMHEEPAEIAEVQKEEKSYTEVAKMQKNENNVDDNCCFLSVLPPGYRFCPRDDELVKPYLMKMVMNEPLPPNRIHVVNLYNYSPYDLARDFQPLSEHTWYFFTPRDRKYPNGKRPNRAAGGGYWRATGADRKIKEGDNVIGARKSFDFYNGKPKHGMKTDWKMHEFRIDGLPENTRTGTEANMRLDDWVLSRIYEKKRRENSEDKVMAEKENSVDDHPSASQPALQVFIEDARTETPSVTSGLVILPPSPPKLMDSVKLPVSNHPDIFPQHNYSQFWSEDNRELMSRGDLGNLDFIDQSSSQPETTTSFIDEYLFAFESYDGQSQYGFIDTNQGSANNFAAGILPTAGSDNNFMPPRWNNDSPVTFNLFSGHPSTSQPALQAFIGDARTETPSVTSGLVILPPSPPKLMDSVKSPVSNHPDIFSQHNDSEFWSGLMSGGDLGNPDFIDQSSSQPETMTSFIDEFRFPFESYDGQSQYGFIDTNQGSVNNFAAGILPTAGSDNNFMASRWNNDSLVTFNSQLPPADALILNPSPVSQRPLGYIDQNNDMSVFYGWKEVDKKVSDVR